MVDRNFRGKIMNLQLWQVQEFNNAFKIETPPAPLLNIDWDRAKFRYNLLKEENDEFLEAAHEKNPVELVDAIGDMLYILCGTVIEYGLQAEIDTIFSEIHRSNMSKLTADGEVVYTHEYHKPKIGKSDQYTPPDFTDILSRIFLSYDKWSESDN